MIHFCKFALIPLMFTKLKQFELFRIASFFVFFEFKRARRLFSWRAKTAFRQILTLQQIYSQPFKALSFCDFLCYNKAFSQSYKNCKINHIRQFINRLFYNFCKKAAYLSSFSKSTESKWEICFFVLTSCVNESLKSPFFTATKESR